MKSLFKFSLFLMLSVFLCPACTVETIEDEDDSGIKNQVAQGFVQPEEAFFTETALVENTEFFDDQGYLFNLFSSDSIECGPNLYGNVRFFVESAVPLKPGNYEGEGPFITSTSFFGCDVVITSVTETTIEGKVKGGNFDGGKNIEGTFVAEICQ